MLEPFCFSSSTLVPLVLGSPLSLLEEFVFDSCGQNDRLGSIWHRKRFFASKDLVLLDCLNPKPVKTICLKKTFRKMNRHQNRHHRLSLFFWSLFVLFKQWFWSRNSGLSKWYQWRDSNPHSRERSGFWIPIYLAFSLGNNLVSKLTCWNSPQTHHALTNYLSRCQASRYCS